jgi:RHS repeat-associated protein
VRYDGETGLYRMSVRAYDPTLGRFISRDPLGRAPLMGWTDQPYAYAGNNPLPLLVDRETVSRYHGSAKLLLVVSPARHGATGGGK